MPDMLMEFSPVTLVDSWVNFLPKNTLNPLLENGLGKENLLFLSNTLQFFNLQVIFSLVAIYLLGSKLIALMMYSLVEK